MASTTTTISTPLLSNDIVSEILVRLPVKSLLRFRCVSKSWNRLISTSQFAKSHLVKSAKHSDLSRQRIMLRIRGNMKLCYCSSFFQQQQQQQPIVDVLDIHSPFLSSTKPVWILGSCHGLICLVVDRKHFILWNPTITKYRQLPDIGLDSSLGTHVAYGFGYDYKSDDYKIVVFNGKKDVSQSVKLYSFKSDEWRTITNHLNCWLMDDPATYVNGKLYWIAYPGLDDSETGGGGDIVSFDLGTDEFEVLQMPSQEEEDSSYSRLAACDGYLYLLCSCLTRADVWMMVVESGEGSWTKVASVPYVDDFLKYSYKKLVHVEKNGELLVLCHPKFVVFNIKDGSFRYPELINAEHSTAATPYIESLVSPIA